MPVRDGHVRLDAERKERHKRECSGDSRARKRANFVKSGFSKSYNQAAEVTSSNVTCKSPRSPSKNCKIMLAFVSMTLSITIFHTVSSMTSGCWQR
jgi:hypothetical protein